MLNNQISKFENLVVKEYFYILKVIVKRKDIR